MFKEIYTCDRKGCTSTTEACGNGPFFYTNPEWIGVKMPGEICDFCSWECLSIWADQKALEHEGGKSK